MIYFINVYESEIKTKATLVLFIIGIYFTILQR
jgi:hypothetical protein